MENFKTFMSVTDFGSVSEITELLSKYNILFKVQDTSKDFDVTFSNDSSKNSYLLMLQQSDFEKATTLLEDKLHFNINEVDATHPLFSFSKDELIDVVKNYDEWHPLDVKLAKFLLNNHGIIVDETVINQEQNTKKLKSQSQEKSTSLTLFLGYAFCIMGGLAGIGIAIFLLTAKRTLQDGTKQYIYTKSDRNHGLYMLVAGALCFMFIILKYS